MATIERLIEQAEKELTIRFDEIEANEEARTRQLLDSFRKFGVSYRHFAPTTGYGYGDIGPVSYRSRADAAPCGQRDGSPEPDPFRTDSTGKTDPECHGYAV